MIRAAQRAAIGLVFLALLGCKQEPLETIATGKPAKRPKVPITTTCIHVQGAMLRLTRALADVRPTLARLRRRVADAGSLRSPAASRASGSRSPES